MRYWGICGAITALALLSTSSVWADTEDEDENAMKPFISALAGVSLFRNLNVYNRADETSTIFPETYEMERPNFAVGGAVGIGDRSLDHQLRVDYRRSFQELSGAKFRVLSMMYQPTIKIHTSSVGLSRQDGPGGSWFYLGVGLGAAQGKTSLAGETDEQPVTGIVDDWEFAYQVAVGFVYALTDQIGIEIGYRYMGTTDFDIVNEKTTPLAFQPQTLLVEEMSFGTNEVTLGLRYQFH